MVSHWTNNSGNATNGHAGSLHLCWGTALTTSEQRKSPLLSSYPYSLPLLIPSPLPSDQIWPNCWPALSKGPLIPRLVLQTGPFFSARLMSLVPNECCSRGLWQCDWCTSCASARLALKSVLLQQWIQIRWVWFIFTLQYNSAPRGRDRTIINWWYVRWQVIIHSYCRFVLT